MELIIYLILVTYVYEILELKTGMLLRSSEFSAAPAFDVDLDFAMLVDRLHSLH